MGCGVAKVVVALGLSLGGCAGGPTAFSDGGGFGLSAPRAASPDELRSTAWDVKLDGVPGPARVTEAADSWTASSGSFTFVVVRNPELGGADARSVVEMLRGEDRERGFDTSEVTDASFLGRPAAMYSSVPERGTTSMTLLAVAGNCVYVLSSTHAGDRGRAAGDFGALVARIGTMSGGPADAPACR
jgi:hypothetical protein